MIVIKHNKDNVLPQVGVVASIPAHKDANLNQKDEGRKNQQRNQKGGGGGGGEPKIAVVVGQDGQQESLGEGVVVSQEVPVVVVSGE